MIVTSLENDSPTGAIIYAIESSKTQYLNYVLINKNSAAERYATIYLADSEFSGCDSDDSLIISSNLGLLVAFNSPITFTGYAIFENNQPS